MKRLPKILFLPAVTIFLFVSLAPAAHAVGILPAAPADCQLKEERTDASGQKTFVTISPPKDVVNALKGRTEFDAFVGGDRGKLEQALGCAVKLGKIRLFMVPFFITFLVQFLLQIAGIVAVLFVVIGGYKYVVGGLTEDKESGKKYIQNALIGLVVALSAWMVVNFIQVALTS